MRRIASCAAVILLTAFLLPPSGVARAGSLCVPDGRSSLGASVVPEGSPLGAGSQATPGAAERASEYLSIRGSTDYVYGSFAGCGERHQFLLGDALRMSYSAASGADPFERIGGRSRDKESFFDAEFESAFGDLGRIGYAASLHTAIVEDTAADRVTGNRLWFSSADKRLALSSEVAVSASETQDRIGTAQRHRISVRLLEAANSSLSTTFSFSSVDRDFKGRRSAATPDRQTLDAMVNLRSGDAALTLTLRSAQDNLDGDRDRTHLWRTITADGSYGVGRRPILPNRIRVYANHVQERTIVSGADGLDDPERETDVVGVALNWTDWFDGSTILDSDAVTLSTNLLADLTETGDDHTSGLATGADAHLSLDLRRILEVPGHMGTGARIIADERLEDGFGWQWNLSAEVDWLDLLFDTASSRAAYLLGRFGSGVSDQAAGLNIDYRGMVAGGIRF
jgi:hypothetical protein